MERWYFYLWLFTLGYVFAFVIYDILTKNYEFLIYLLFISFSLAIVFLTRGITKFSSPVLWLLSILGFLHMCYGGIFINGKSLYGLNLFHIVGSGDGYVLRFDQVVHALGIFMITLVGYFIIEIHFTNQKSFFVYLITFFIGVGWGTIVELTEFATVILFSNTRVGGYYNNTLDLLFNAIGALLASVILWGRDKYRERFG